MNTAIVEIQDVTSEGDGVGRQTNGQVVFVPQTFPGDCVEIAVQSTTARFVRAQYLRILKPSPQRVQPLCQVPHCQGCSWQTLQPTAQQTQKHHMVREIFQRIAKQSIPEQLIHPPIPLPQTGFGLRHRVRLHAEIHPSQQRWQLGYRRRKAHTIVPFSTCITLIPPLKHALPIFFEHWQHHIPLELKSAQIHWAATPAGTLAFAIVPTIPTGFPQWQSALKRLLAALTPELPGLQGCLFTSQHHIHRQGSPMLQYPHPASQPLFFEPSAFTQATPLVNNQLIACIQHHIQTLTPQHVVELFAGIGNLTLAVAETGVPIAAYENHPLSSHWHRQNLQPLAHATFFQKAATAAFPLPPHTELLILDPPRKGAAAELTLLSSSPHRPPAILYISCHAATLARDARLLHSLGYTPTDIRCFDMFPHTPHVEICALFQ